MMSIQVVLAWVMMRVVMGVILPRESQIFTTEDTELS